MDSQLRAIKAENDRLGESLGKQREINRLCIAECEERVRRVENESKDRYNKMHSADDVEIR